jgi:hypothetical protein
MPTCVKHGSGGERNKKLGLIRYLAWVICGVPKDTPQTYARSVSIAAALEMMFNHGYGSVEQRLNAAMWLMQAEHPYHPATKAYKDAKAAGEEEGQLSGLELFAATDTEASASL